MIKDGIIDHHDRMAPHDIKTTDADHMTTLQSHIVTDEARAIIPGIQRRL